VFQKREKSTSPSKLEFPQTQANQIQFLLQHQVSDYDHLTFGFFVEKLDYFFQKLLNFRYLGLTKLLEFLDSNDQIS